MLCTELVLCRTEHNKLQSRLRKTIGSVLGIPRHTFRVIQFLIISIRTPHTTHAKSDNVQSQLTL